MVVGQTMVSGILPHTDRIEAFSFLSVHLLNKGELRDNPHPKCFIAFRDTGNKKSMCLQSRRYHRLCLASKKKCSQHPFSWNRPWTDPPLERSDGVMHPRRAEAFPCSSQSQTSVDGCSICQLSGLASQTSQLGLLPVLAWGA